MQHRTLNKHSVFKKTHGIKKYISIVKTLVFSTIIVYSFLIVSIIKTAVWTSFKKTIKFKSNSQCTRNFE